MNWFTVALMLIPHIKEIIKHTEKFFDDVGDSGIQKKEYALAILKELGMAVTGLAGDEFDKMWVYIETALGFVIDMLCTIFFPHDEQEIVG